MFAVRFTSQYKPEKTTSPTTDAVPARVIATPANFWDCFVGIPLDDGRDGGFTMSVEDEALAGIEPLEHMVQIFYRGNLELWGQITEIVEDLREGTAVISVRDRCLVLENHYLRNGDEALLHPSLVNEVFGGLPDYLTYTNIDGDDEVTTGTVPSTSRGLRRVMWAARNTAAQTARGMPDLGIDLGDAWDTWGISTSEYTPEKAFVARRDDQVLSTMQDIAKKGPDWELEPWNTIEAHDPTTTNPYYAKLNTYSEKGADDALSGPTGYTPVFDMGVQWDNLENIERTRGGQTITHAAVNAADDRTRVVVANKTASAETGAFVGLFNTDYRPANRSALWAHGQSIVKARGRPPHTLTLTVKADSDAGMLYREHYTLGQTVIVRARRGQTVIEDSARITKVTLEQRDRGGNSGATLEVAPRRVTESEVAFGVRLDDGDLTGTDDGSTRTAVDIGFDYTFGSAGVQRFVFPTTDGTLIFADPDQDQPIVLYGTTIDFLSADPTALIGVAATAADHVLASNPDHGYTYPGYSGISYTTVGTEDGRVFACTFDLPFLAGSEANGEHVRCQVQLHENGNIEVHYETFAIDPGDAIASLTIGLWWRDSTDADRTLLGEIDGNTYNDDWPASPIPDEQAVRYVPDGDDWSQEPAIFNWIETEGEDA